MDYSLLLSKTARDKNGLKLGKIINLEQMPGKTIKKLKPYFIVRVKQGFLLKPLIITLEAEKLLKYNKDSAFFNITKAEFEEEVERQKIIIYERDSRHWRAQQERRRKGLKGR